MNKDGSAITRPRSSTSPNHSASTSTETNSHTKETRSEDTLAKGTVLKKRFLLTGLIATGGTSYIYKARDLLAAMSADESSEIVLKLTRHNLNDKTSPTEIALHEALTTRNLAHPNIVKVYDYDCDEPYCFVTMEYLTGETLSKKLQRSVDYRLSYRQAMDIAIPTSAALHHAHQQGVVHSDVKPGNIILTFEGVVKVIDFGTARPNSHATRTSKQANEAEYSGFTPVYASPQTLREQPATASDDVFSFACTLYEMLTGQHPYKRVTADVAERKDMRATRFKSINIWQWYVLNKALSFKQKQRYSDISQFMRQFTRARHVWSGLAVLLLSVSLSAYLLVSTVNFFSSHKTTDKQLAILSADLEQVANLINKIHQAPAGDRFKLLNSVKVLPDVYRDSVYRGVRSQLVDDLVNEVNRKLYNSTDETDYSSISGNIQNLRKIYPDSAKLDDIAELIEREQLEYGSAMLIKYNEQLEETTFTNDETADIQNTREKLRQLDINTPAVDQKVAIRYVNALNNAYRRFDYRLIDQLISFKTTIAMTLPSAIKNKIRINANQIEAAQTLAEFNRKSPAKPALYPKLAAASFWSPYFDKIGARINNSWNNKELYGLKQELDNFRNRLPSGYPPLTTALKALAEKYRSKARYYKRKGAYRKQVRKLNKTANEILNSITG